MFNSYTKRPILVYPFEKENAMLNIHLIIAFAAFMAYEVSQAQSLPQVQTCEVSQAEAVDGSLRSHSVCKTSMRGWNGTEVEVCEVVEVVSQDVSKTARTCHRGMLAKNSSLQEAYMQKSYSSNSSKSSSKETSSSRNEVSSLKEGFTELNSLSVSRSLAK